MAVLIGDDKKVIDLIKHKYLQDSIIPSCDETKSA